MSGGAPTAGSPSSGDSRGPGHPGGAHHRNCRRVTGPGLPMHNPAGVHGQSVLVLGPSQVAVAKLLGTG